MTYFRIANWKRFQHYKERNPPWVKLHRELLTSRAWISGDDTSRTLLIALMLIAADTDNLIPADPGYIRRRAYLNTDPDFSWLLEVGFIEHASDMLASCKRDARPEAETETDPPLKNILTRKENPKALRPISAVEKTYSPADFDERNRRIEWEKRQSLKKARDEVKMILNGGADLTDKEVYELWADKSGLSVQEILELDESAKKWPQAQTMGASA